MPWEDWSATGQFATGEATPPTGEDGVGDAVPGTYIWVCYGGDAIAYSPYDLSLQGTIPFPTFKQGYVNDQLFIPDDEVAYVAAKQWDTEPYVLAMQCRTGELLRNIVWESLLEYYTSGSYYYEYYPAYTHRVDSEYVYVWKWGYQPADYYNNQLLYLVRLNKTDGTFVDETLVCTGVNGWQLLFDDTYYYIFHDQGEPGVSSDYGIRKFKRSDMSFVSANYDGDYLRSLGFLYNDLIYCPLYNDSDPPSILRAETFYKGDMAFAGYWNSDWPKDQHPVVNQGLYYNGYAYYFCAGGDPDDVILKINMTTGLVEKYRYQNWTGWWSVGPYRWTGGGDQPFPSQGLYPCGDTPPSIVTGAAAPPRTAGWVPFHMIEIRMSAQTIYLCNSDRTITWNGNAYTKFPFSVSAVKRSAGTFEESGSVSASNVDRSMAQLLMSEVIEGKNITIRKCYWNQDFGHTEPYIVFDGQVDVASIEENNEDALVTLQYKNEFWNWRAEIPNNAFGITCQHSFKSNTPGCQYIGTEVSCDRSFERCTQLGNTSRFRGFRHMGLIMDNEIWWGKTRESSD